MQKNHDGAGETECKRKNLTWEYIKVRLPLPTSQECDSKSKIVFWWDGTRWRVTCNGREITGDLAVRLIEAVKSLGLPDDPEPDIAPEP
jgi:hypothetical protein